MLLTFSGNANALIRKATALNVAKSVEHDARGLGASYTRFQAVKAHQTLRNANTPTDICAKANQRAMQGL